MLETLAPAHEIPRLIHQTFSTKDVPAEIRQNIASLQALNPGWSYALYDDADIVEYIRNHFGQEVLKRYLSINPLYGAARADLFRYLLLYKSEEFHTNGNYEGDVKIGYTFPNQKYDVFFYVQNITDKQNVQGAIDFDDLTGFVGDPRVIGAGFDIHF